MLILLLVTLLLWSAGLLLLDRLRTGFCASSGCWPADLVQFLKREQYLHQTAPACIPELAAK